MTYIRLPMLSAAEGYGEDDEAVIRAVAAKYIRDHPKAPFVYRAVSREGWIRDADCRYVLNMEQKLPELSDGQRVYAWAKCFCPVEEERVFSISCFGPAALYVNGKLAFRSTIAEEVFPDLKKNFGVVLRAGWNHFVLSFEKTGTGCGARFGTGMIKRHPMHFIVPSAEREGEEGWIYTPGLYKPLDPLPGEGMSEQDYGEIWLPRRNWRQEELSEGVFGRLFGAETPEAVAYAWTRVGRTPDSGPIVLKGRHAGKVAIYMDGRKVYESGEEYGTFAIALPADIQAGNLVVRSRCGAAGKWDVRIEEVSGRLELPYPVEGASGEVWLYTGPFSRGEEPQIQSLCSMERVFMSSSGGEYWRLDRPGGAVRPFVESVHYGKWNYPLGVTLYGLIKSGQLLGETNITGYALHHIEQCTAYDLYALWDQERYGVSGINHQLAAIDSLDDCGSFGVALLYAMERREIKGADEAVSRIASYIRDVQERLPDGTLYRGEHSQGIKQRTVWCDDLYMSVPFLVRYAKRTGEPEWLNEACSQLLRYRSYLYREDDRLFSHVYDFKFKKTTGIPWGRGNGWAYFALTELLTELPSGHPDAENLMKWYEEISGGLVERQGSSGLWHQVLDDPSTYEETSCTAMFIYGLARGLRRGWLADKEGHYTEAVRRGWDGLKTGSIDREGNVYGVCRGSGYSFSRKYYAQELEWKLNDTHGIGIVLLAGAEYAEMQWAMEAAEKSNCRKQGI